MKKQPGPLSEENAAIITSAIEHLQENDQHLPAEKLNYEMWLKEFSGIQDFLEDVGLQNNDVFNKKLAAEGERLDLIIFEHMTLSLVLTPFADLNTITRKDQGDSSKVLLFFTMMLNNGINSLLSLKTLLSMGMDFQARVILRNYIETMELAMAILLNEQFFNFYMKDPKGKKEEKARWDKTRPSEVARIISAAAEKDEPLKEMWNLGKAIRDHLYDNSSKAVHAVSVAVFVGANPSLIDSDKAGAGLGGHISNGTRSTLNNAFQYGGFCLHFLQKILQYAHGIDVSALPKGDHYAFISDINKLLWLHIMHNLSIRGS